MDEIRTALAALAKQATEDTARRLLVGNAREVEAQIAAALAAHPTARVELAATTGLADAYRGAFAVGLRAERGEIWTWLGSAYICLETTGEPPNRRDSRVGKGSWGLIASSGSGSGGGSGGDSLPSQAGNNGKFLTTDGAVASWATLAGGGDMLAANDLSDVASITQSRTNLGLGTLATQDGTFSGSSSGTNTGDNAVNSLYSGLVSNANHSGDATGDTALTLATVNSNVGAFGSATRSVSITVNAKGLVTAAASVTIAPAVGDVTGMASGVVTWLTTPSSANLAAAVTDETGSGALVFATSPTFVTPFLATPSGGNLASCTGLPIATGVSGLGSNVSTFLATPSSANLAAALTDETGSGLAVFGTSPVITTPTLVSPTLGIPVSGDLHLCTNVSLTAGVIGTLPNANLANMVANTIKGRTTQSTGAPEDCTVAQIQYMLAPITHVAYSATITLQLSDLGKYITVTTAGATVINIPTNASVSFPLGAQIMGEQGGLGVQTFTGITGSVTVNSRGAALKTAGTYAVWALTQTSTTNVWTLTGDISVS
jgi:hypothetical protein